MEGGGAMEGVGVEVPVGEGGEEESESMVAELDSCEESLCV